MNRADTPSLDATDRKIINVLQDGLPLSLTPYADAAKGLGLGEDELIGRLQELLDRGLLSRFGPMYNADRMGGANVLAAMRIPVDDFERIADIVNGFDEVSHNYARDHALNMWFVISVLEDGQVQDVIHRIETATALKVYAMPKEEEFFIGLKFAL